MNNETEINEEREKLVLSSIMIPAIKMGMVFDGECGRIVFEFPLNMLSSVGENNFKAWFELSKLRTYQHTFDLEIQNVVIHGRD